MAHPFKLGIAGSGFMGSTHRAALAGMESIEVAAVSNWRELIGLSDLDAIDICLPTDLHATVAIEALARGKHVFCEKPMALTTIDCERMIAASEEHGRVLMIGHVLRFWPEYRELKKFLEGNRHTVTSATLSRHSAVPDWGPWLSEENRSGGAILDLLIHDIDQALLLFGMPRSVSARSIGPVDTMEARLEYSDAFAVRIEGGWFPQGTAFHMSATVTTTHEKKRFTPCEGDGAYRAELEYFVECCRANRSPALCLPQDALNAVRLALLLKAARERGGERIPCVL